MIMDNIDALEAKIQELQVVIPSILDIHQKLFSNQQLAAKDKEAYIEEKVQPKISSILQLKTNPKTIHLLKRSLAH